MGQYTQVDPIGLAGGNPTLYGDVFNSLIDIDPYGLSGRTGRRRRLIEIMNDPKQAGHIRGWIRQELNRAKGYIRNPKGYELARW